MGEVGAGGKGMALRGVGGAVRVQPDVEADAGDAAVRHAAARLVAAGAADDASRQVALLQPLGAEAEASGTAPPPPAYTSIFDDEASEP